MQERPTSYAESYKHNVRTEHKVIWWLQKARWPTLQLRWDKYSVSALSINVTFSVVFVLSLWLLSIFCSFTILFFSKYLQNWIGLPPRNSPLSALWEREIGRCPMNEKKKSLSLHTGLLYNVTFLDWFYLRFNYWKSYFSYIKYTTPADIKLHLSLLCPLT